MEPGASAPGIIPTSGTSDDICRWVWQNLVPQSNQSGFVQGELLRAVEKLSWEAQNNGNGNWDQDFERLLAFLKRTFAAEPGLDPSAKDAIERDLVRLSIPNRPYTEDDLYDRLREQVAAFCRLHPEPIPKPHDPELRR